MRLSESSTNIQQLTELAHEIFAYTQSIPYGGTEQKQKAKAILNEIDKTLQEKNEFFILRVFEASIIPKLISLAKDLWMYRSFTEKQSKASIKVSQPPRVATAYAPYPKVEKLFESYEQMDTQKKEAVDQMFSELYQILEPK